VPVALALGTVAVPTLWVFGLMGWMSRPITPVSSTIPVLVMAVGITDAVHFLVRAHEFRRLFSTTREASIAVAAEIGSPTTVTAITSGLGFLSFLAGDMPNLQDFGLFAAVGIVGAWLLTFTALPVMFVRLRPAAPASPPPVFDLGDQFLRATREASRRRPARLIAITVALSLISLVGIAHLVPETSGWQLLGGSDPLVRSERLLRERLRPTDSLEVLYEAPAGHTIVEPIHLSRLARIEEALATVTNGRAVLSPLAVLRVAHREIAGTDLSVPPTASAAAQLLLLVEAADATSLGRILTPDHRLARLSAPYATDTTASIRIDQERVRTLLATAGVGPEGGMWNMTGTTILIAHQSDVILSSQIASFSTAFATIFLVILLFVRSLPLGLLGMIPNVLPVVAILGFMGFAGINLDVGTAMIASILLGVSVDDTVYFLIHYIHARQRGAGMSDAVAFTFAVAGKPALFCACVLALGFFVLGFSSFQSLSIFGVLSGFSVLLAVCCELVLMPATLELLGRRS
jgi:hypothetical protein